jgi:hypothetical protein
MTAGMRSGVFARVAVVLVLAVAPLAPLVVFDDSAVETRQPRPELENRLERLVGAHDEGAASVASTDREVVVVLKLERGAALPESVDAERVYTREGTRLLRTRVPISAVRDLGKAPQVEAVRIQRDFRGDWSNTSTRVAPGVATVNADALHERGLTGENVTVGIIGDGFRPGAAEVAGSVAAYRTFDDGTTGWRHGTAVASVVVDTAPDADLYLASVGASTTPEEYADAVAWLGENDVDVVLDAGSYFGQPGDGSGEIARIAARTTNESLFVTSAGNYGRRHWQGTHAATGGSGWVEFADGVEGNHLNDGEPFAGRVQVSLRWDEWPTDDDYDLYLMREQFGDDEVVAVSNRRQDGDDPVEHVDVTVPRGRYYVAIRENGADGSHRVELFANRQLRYRTPEGSLTSPATADGAFVVGATTNDTVAAYSSRGTVDRLGVDAAAPASVAMPGVENTDGTAYAAPYAAGVAALLYERYEMSHDTAASVLRASAVDVGELGPDPATGHGRLNALEAYRLAGEWTRYAGVNAST